MTDDFRVGDRVWVDGVPCVVEGTSRYVGGSQTFARKMGITVRPLAGGRARVVALWRAARADAAGAPTWPGEAS